MDKKKVIAGIVATTLAFSGVAAAMAQINNDNDAVAAPEYMKIVGKNYESFFNTQKAAVAAAKAAVAKATAEVKVAQAAVAKAQEDQESAAKAYNTYCSENQCDPKGSGVLTDQAQALKNAADNAQGVLDKAKANLSAAENASTARQKDYEDAYALLKQRADKFNAQYLAWLQKTYLPDAQASAKVANTNAAAAAQALKNAEDAYTKNPSAENKTVLEAAKIAYERAQQKAKGIIKALKETELAINALTDPNSDKYGVLPAILGQLPSVNTSSAPETPDTNTPGKKTPEAKKTDTKPADVTTVDVPDLTAPKAEVKAEAPKASASKAEVKAEAAKAEASKAVLAHTGAETAVPALLTVVATALAAAFASVRRLFVK